MFLNVFTSKRINYCSCSNSFGSYLLQFKVLFKAGICSKIQMTRLKMNFSFFGLESFSFWEIFCIDSARRASTCTFFATLWSSWSTTLWFCWRPFLSTLFSCIGSCFLLSLFRSNLFFSHGSLICVDEKYIRMSFCFQFKYFFNIFLEFNILVLLLFVFSVSKYIAS